MARPASGSKQQERQRLIAEHILREGTVKIDGLHEQFEISFMTIHRDLDELEARGLIRKSRGWVTAMSSSVAEASDVFRQGQQEHEKAALAAAALEFIAAGQSVFLDDSTTTAQLAPLVAARAPLTIITNYLTLMNEVRQAREIALIGLGGTYMTWSSSFLGSVTTNSIRSIAADLFIMSSSAVIDDVCYHHSQQTVEVKRAMFESAARRILLLDHTKFERRALHALLAITDFDEVIVDDHTPPETVDRLRNRGISLTVAPSLSES
ncbi:DeoR/GlpR family DNA-binding transcription regulator [Microbacterium allomyrinae]|jgi:DeoR/GlpR family transcriptional regulator of sugar metabolism|uniref:DeoR/GlpR transcriptional regulator n=1 Tax=Microbacterium allomyrinae TaxID=2830666 RepID=A0A9X1S2Z3_9MICO|nr:DeoR/GlpR family DNA-binding transcription regulator [Microbacterium allomyrinae]MCC2032609.1 DeoR/GlpR transcriptional regulator [Microbacterium allomyrinae]